MNGILSIIVAVVMALSGMTATMTDAVTAEVNLTANKEAILSLDAGTAPADEAAANAADQTAMIGLGADVLNGLGIRGTADNKALELVISKDGNTLINVGLQMDESGVTLASNLLGNQVLSLSGETMTKIMEEMAKATQTAEANDPMSSIMQTIQNIDFQKLSEEVTAITGKAMAEFQSKIGEPETGVFEMDGTAFNAKTPINITDQELALLGLNLAKEILAIETIQPVLQMIPNGADLAAEIDKKIEEATNMTAEARFETDIALYTNEAGGSWFSFDASRQTIEPKTVAHLGIGQPEAGHSEMILKVDVDGQVNIDLAFEKDEDSMGVLLGTITTPGEDGFKAQIIVAEDETGITSDVTVMSNGNAIRSLMEESFGDEMKATLSIQKVGVDGSELTVEADLLTLAVTVSAGGEIATVFSGDDLSVINVEDLLSEDSEKQQQASGTLMAGFMGGFMTAISTLISSVPAESGEMLTNMIGPMLGMPAQ